MNREIKFRAWDNVEWKMYYNHSVCLTIDGDVSFLNTSGEWEKDDDKSMITLMQYTGLKDKNGVEIYEGDIVILNHWKSTDLFDYGNPFIVSWEYGQIAFKQNGCYNFIGSLTGKIELEIIGDIYSSPELLKQSI